MLFDLVASVLLEHYHFHAVRVSRGFPPFSLPFGPLRRTQNLFVGVIFVTSCVVFVPSYSKQF